MPYGYTLAHRWWFDDGVEYRVEYWVRDPSHPYNDVCTSIRFF